MGAQGPHPWSKYLLALTEPQACAHPLQDPQTWQSIPGAMLNKTSHSDCGQEQRYLVHNLATTLPRRCAHAPSVLGPHLPLPFSLGWSGVTHTLPGPSQKEGGSLGQTKRSGQAIILYKWPGMDKDA
eukprot:1157457-Pelagomonas_calceolata.AAC.9